jgi:hypothetical protein
MTTSGNMLREAALIVDGARQTTHGGKERSFKAIADLWNAYLNGRVIDGRDAAMAGVSPFDVAQMMVLVKIARSIQGKPIRDHFVDEAGYAAIAGELAAVEEKDELPVRGGHAATFDEMIGVVGKSNVRGSNKEMEAAREVPGRKTRSPTLVDADGVFTTCDSCEANLACAIKQTCIIALGVIR